MSSLTTQPKTEAAQTPEATVGATSSLAAAEKPAAKIRVALILQGTHDDGTWNAMAWEGFQKLKENGIETTYSESVLDSDVARVLRNYASSGWTFNPFWSWYISASALAACWRTMPLLWRTRADQEISRLAEAYQLLVPLHEKVSQLSIGEQQRVEILKLIYRGARILILDEPTASLTRPETEALFRFLRQMTARGHAVVFISHKFEEVLNISDRIAVLRQGRVVATLRTREANEQELAYLMVGRDLSAPRSRLASARGESVAVIKGLAVAGRHRQPIVEALDLQLHAGEIVGVAGVDGNGQTELAEVLAGLRPMTAVGHCHQHLAGR
jgi:energy-coupling factor transporter ATP-binding protein EcfA2